MMESQIEKMHENAGVKKINTHQSKIDNGDPRFTGISHSDSYIDYPPFTAEKQLELIKLIANRKGYPDYEYFGALFDDYIQLREFDEALARLVNDLWQDLTEEERKQIKEILE